MDIQTPPGYFMKLADGIQNKTIPAVHADLNSDVNSQVTYLISLEQPDGTCQMVQLSEEDARSLGILSNGTSDNTNSTTNFIETTTNLTNSIEANNINFVKQPAIPPNTVHPEKVVDILKTPVVICDDGNINEQQMGTNLLTYSPTILKADNSSEVLQVSEEGKRTFGIFLNDAEDSITNIESTETVSTNLVEISHAKRTTKVPNKTVSPRKKVVRLKKNPPAKKRSRKQKQPEINLLPYSPTMLQVKGAPQVLQITEGQAKALGILGNGIPANDISNGTSSNAVSVTENIQTTPIDANNTNSLNHVAKSTKAVQHRKKIVKIKKNIPADACNSELLNNKQDVNIYSYPTTSKKSQLVQLAEEEAKALQILSNGVSNSVGVSQNIVRSPIETIKTKALKRPKFTNKLVTHRKEVAPTAKESATEACNSTSKDGFAEAMKPLGSSENPIEVIKDGEVLHSTQNLSQDCLKQIAGVLQLKSAKSDKAEEKTSSDAAANVVYRVVFPEELDLNPNPKPPKPLLKRGRPKKRYCLEEDPELILEEPKPPKNMRTRSGRITRPPQHIRKDFKKIETSEVDTMETDLKIVEFEPLQTNQPATAVDTPVKISQLDNHQRKRSIASQFRCPKCKKAYLGHSKMLKHLQKHPDHGPIPDHCKLKHDQMWNFLIDLCNKSPVGQKGLKFCREVVHFLHNVRVLAKIFFKRPLALDKNLYFVDSTLSSVLGIESGNYVLNENELHTKVDMLAFINSKCFKDANADATKNSSNTDVKLNNEGFDLGAFVEKCQTDNQQVLHEDFSFPENGHDIALNRHSNNDFCHKLDSNGIDKNSKSSGTLGNTNFQENKISFDTIQSSEANDFSLNCDITAVSTFNSELQKYDEHIISDFTGRSLNENCIRKSPQLNINTSASQAHEQNDHQKSITSELSLHSELLSDNSLLNSLPNLRTSVDELMLNNVDSTQVTNLLDNSTSSDEVMNVDQFVNERFKNLTESDLELPNTSLTLDLPLDLFQFHTS